MMRAIGISILVCLVGCSGKTSAPAGGDVPPDSVTAIDDSNVPAATDPRYGMREIGDVVAHLELAVALDVRSNLPSLKNTESLTKKDILAMVIIDVSPPIPEELWMGVRVISGKNFPGTLVLVKGSIFVEGKEVGSFAHVMGAEAREQTMLTTFDLMEVLDEVPETLLIHATAKVSVFEGDDESAIDPATAVAPAGKTSVIESNPARINFIQ